MSDIIKRMKELKWKWFVIALLLPVGLLIDGLWWIAEFIHFKVTGKLVDVFRRANKNMNGWLEEFEQL